MSILVKNTRSLISPQMKWKVLVIGMPGSGKTTWLATAPNPGVAACETGFGSGLQSVAKSGVDFIEPRTKAELEMFCTGKIFADKETLGADSLTAMTRTIIKDHALAFQRRGGNSDKRAAGVPELDDYGTIGEITRSLLAKLLEVDKHIVVTAGQRAEKDSDGNTKGLGPDLPGMMFLAAPAMFDSVLFFKTRKVLLDPRDKRTEVIQHYILTANDGFHVAKCRAAGALAPEEIFDLKTGQGSFPYLLDKITRTYQAPTPVPAPQV